MLGQLRELVDGFIVFGGGQGIGMRLSIVEIIRQPFDQQIGSHMQTAIDGRKDLLAMIILRIRRGSGNDREIDS